MKNIYYEITIENEMDCADPECLETTGFSFYRSDLTVSELKAIDLDDIEEDAEQTHRNWEWRKLHGEWYCPAHAALLTPESGSEVGDE